MSINSKNLTIQRFPPKANSESSGNVPEVEPSRAPSFIPIYVPIANTFTDTDKKSSISTTKTTTTATSSSGRINTISNEDAINAMQKAQSANPDKIAITTSMPSKSISTSTSIPVSPPIPSSNTLSTMSSTTVPVQVQVVDSVSSPSTKQ
jgi:hypothetical protein